MNESNKLIPNTENQCLKCKKNYIVEIQKYRFCKDCRIDFGNQTYLDNHSVCIVRERVNRKEYKSLYNRNDT